MEIIVSQRILRTFTREGFVTEYYTIIQSSGFTAREAWEYLEEMRISKGFPPRYSSYDSFRAAKSRLLRINSKKNE